jgi:hypothetical protein
LPLTLIASFVLAFYLKAYERSWFLHFNDQTIWVQFGLQIANLSIFE